MAPAEMPKTGGETLPWLLLLGAVVLVAGLALRKRATA
jgi:LPXTG-motif cell wall-anchored protein